MKYTITCFYIFKGITFSAAAQLMLGPESTQCMWVGALSLGIAAPLFAFLESKG